MIQNSGLRLQFPSTPVSTHTSYKDHGGSYAHRPINSSPLAGTSSSSGSSPIAAVQARRRSQYKASRPSLSVPSSSRSNATSTRPLEFAAPPDAGDDSQYTFLRTRLKLRCIERASKARERAVQKNRFMSSSEAGCDDMDMDDAEGEDPAFDELFTRIIHNTTRKMHHAYMYSYDREVGSFDPDMEESRAWETELVRPSIAAQTALDEAALAEDDAALQAYLEEQAAFADFADIPADQLFSWSDVDEDLADAPVQHGAGNMDMS
ncbi:hypothetical protein DFH07DRAFT_730874 [Mycena maculata]|uniref:Uncharacterized protein n=1 Tax=Mycena maculata TaxID=230809 RepID=A0AAD7NVS1_9AGAR|nr:hypothetical protein DFH07DRAFT_730874 [Mycena maculata]